MKLLAFSIPGNGGPIEIKPVAGMPTTPDGTLAFATIVQWGVTVLITFAVIAALFFLIWGGISWIASGGEKEKIEEARKKIVYALIGLTIIFLSFFIITTIGDLFGIKPLNFLNLKQEKQLERQCPEGTHLKCTSRSCICAKN